MTGALRLFVVRPARLLFIIVLLAMCVRSSAADDEVERLRLMISASGEDPEQYLISETLPQPDYIESYCRGKRLDPQTVLAVAADAELANYKGTLVRESSVRSRLRQLQGGLVGWRIPSQSFQSKWLRFAFGNARSIELESIAVVDGNQMIVNPFTGARIGREIYVKLHITGARRNKFRRSEGRVWAIFLSRHEQTVCVR